MQEAQTVRKALGRARQELVEFPAGLLLEPASLPEVKEFKGSASSKIVAAAQSGRRIGSWGCG